MGYSNNHGLVTPMKGAMVFAARVTDLTVADGSDCTVEDQGSAGFIRSVEHDDTGVYIVKLAFPYPPRLIAALVDVHQADPTDAILSANAPATGYNPATGELTITVSNGTAAANPAADDELHLVLFFARYTIV